MLRLCCVRGSGPSTQPVHQGKMGLWGQPYSPEHSCFLQWFWFSLPLWALTSSPPCTPVVLAHVYLLGIKMYLNFGNENGSLNRKHGRLICSSLPLLHLLSICFTNQNTSVFKALGWGRGGRPVHAPPNLFVLEDDSSARLPLANAQST